MSREPLENQAPSLGFQAATQIGQERWPAGGGANEGLAQHDHFGGVEGGQGHPSRKVQIVGSGGRQKEYVARGEQFERDVFTEGDLVANQALVQDQSDDVAGSVRARWQRIFAAIELR